MNSEESIVLAIIRNGKEYKEGDIIEVSGVGEVTILHITTSGFLYNYSPQDESYVTVVHGKGMQNDYYKNWDTLEFIEGDVQEVEV